MKTGEPEVSKSFVALGLGTRRFALPAEIVEELAPSLRLHRFPHRSPGVSGVIVRRGRIVPVIDLATILSTVASSSQHFYLIADCKIGQSGELVAIPVDGECELATGDMETVVNQPSYILGALRNAGEVVDVLDINALLPSGTAGVSSTAPETVQP